MDFVQAGGRGGSGVGAGGRGEVADVEIVIRGQGDLGEHGEGGEDLVHEGFAEGIHVERVGVQGLDEAGAQRGEGAALLGLGRVDVGVEIGLGVGVSEVVALLEDEDAVGQGADEAVDGAWAAGALLDEADLHRAGGPPRFVAERRVERRVDLHPHRVLAGGHDEVGFGDDADEVQVEDGRVLEALDHRDGAVALGLAALDPLGLEHDALPVLFERARDWLVDSAGRAVVEALEVLAVDLAEVAELEAVRSRVAGGELDQTDLERDLAVGDAEAVGAAGVFGVCGVGHGALNEDLVQGRVGVRDQALGGARAARTASMREAWRSPRTRPRYSRRSSLSKASRSSSSRQSPSATSAQSRRTWSASLCVCASYTLARPPPWARVITIRPALWAGEGAWAMVSRRRLARSSARHQPS